MRRSSGVRAARDVLEKHLPRETRQSEGATDSMEDSILDSIAQDDVIRAFTTAEDAARANGGGARWDVPRRRRRVLRGVVFESLVDARRVGLLGAVKVARRALRRERGGERGDDARDDGSECDDGDWVRVRCGCVRFASRRERQRGDDDGERGCGGWSLRFRSMARRGEKSRGGISRVGDSNFRRRRGALRCRRAR